MDKLRLKSILLKHEGLRLTAYTDTASHKTIGIGFNLDADGAEAICEAFDIDYLRAREGTASLTDTQINGLFDYSIDRAFADAHLACPQFDSLSEGAQLALCDMAFNLGAAGLGHFRKMLAALGKQPPNYEQAAIEMLDSLWASQVGKRADDDMALMTEEMPCPKNT